jgi:uncharacterized protein YndB with AHSA1/START domain
MTPTTDGPTTEVEQIVREETIVEADLERVWHAISDPEELESWLADRVSFEPVPGSDASFAVDGDERRGRIDEFCPQHRIAFTWEREPGIPSRVRIELASCVSGIRVVVTESGGRAGHRMLAAGSRSGPGEALARLQATLTPVAA